MMNIPESEFKIEELKVRENEKAPIFESIKCEKCEELVAGWKLFSYLHYLFWLIF